MPHQAAPVICGIAVLAMLARPFRIPEWVWAAAGALALAVFGLVSTGGALQAVGRGTEVYLFLIGMMALSEVARYEGLFDWIASHALRAAGGSGRRLFALLFGVGVAVTALLSNDATAIVLTPAVLAATRRARTEPLPHLYACAFVANAASFILPISNPANLVMFANRPPALIVWLQAFGVAAFAAVGLTFVVLYALFRKTLAQNDVSSAQPHRSLNRRQRVALAVVLASAAALVATAAFGGSIGVASAVCGAVSLIAVALFDRSAPPAVLQRVSWSIVPLVAALFVLVQALDENGALAVARSFLHAVALQPPLAAKLGIGAAAAVLCNVFNNLPVGLLFTYAAHAARALPPAHVYDAGLVAVDLAPNFSVTGSLATLLWLVVLRREGIDVTAAQFLRIGAVVTVPALLLALLLTR